MEDEFAENPLDMSQFDDPREDAEQQPPPVTPPPPPAPPTDNASKAIDTNRNSKSPADEMAQEIQKLREERAQWQEEQAELASLRQEKAAWQTERANWEKTETDLLHLRREKDAWEEERTSLNTTLEQRNTRLRQHMEAKKTQDAVYGKLFNLVRKDGARPNELKDTLKAAPILDSLRDSDIWYKHMADQVTFAKDIRPLIRDLRARGYAVSENLMVERSAKNQEISEADVVADLVSKVYPVGGDVDMVDVGALQTELKRLTSEKAEDKQKLQAEHSVRDWMMGQFRDIAHHCGVYIHAQDRRIARLGRVAAFLARGKDGCLPFSQATLSEMKNLYDEILSISDTSHLEAIEEKVRDISFSHQIDYPSIVLLAQGQFDLETNAKSVLQRIAPNLQKAGWQQTLYQAGKKSMDGATKQRVETIIRENGMYAIVEAQHRLFGKQSINSKTMFDARAIDGVKKKPEALHAGTRVRTAYSRIDLEGAVLRTTPDHRYLQGMLRDQEVFRLPLNDQGKIDMTGTNSGPTPPTEPPAPTLVPAENDSTVRVDDSSKKLEGFGSLDPSKTRPEQAAEAAIRAQPDTKFPKERCQKRWAMYLRQDVLDAIFDEMHQSITMRCEDVRLLLRQDANKSILSIPGDHFAQVSRDMETRSLERTDEGILKVKRLSLKLFVQNKFLRVRQDAEPDSSLGIDAIPFVARLITLLESDFYFNALTMPIPTAYLRTRYEWMGSYEFVATSGFFLNHFLEVIAKLERVEAPTAAAEPTVEVDDDFHDGLTDEDDRSASAALKGTIKKKYEKDEAYYASTGPPKRGLLQKATTVGAGDIHTKSGGELKGAKGWVFWDSIAAAVDGLEDKAWVRPKNKYLMVLKSGRIVRRYNTPSRTKSTTLPVYMYLPIDPTHGLKMYVWGKEKVLLIGPAWICFRMGDLHQGCSPIIPWELESCPLCKNHRGKGQNQILDFGLETTYMQDKFLKVAWPEHWKVRTTTMSVSRRAATSEQNSPSTPKKKGSRKSVVASETEGGTTSGHSASEKKLPKGRPAAESSPFSSPLGLTHSTPKQEIVSPKQTPNPRFLSKRGFARPNATSPTTKSKRFTLSRMARLEVKEKEHKALVLRAVRIDFERRSRDLGTFNLTVNVIEKMCSSNIVRCLNMLRRIPLAYTVASETDQYPNWKPGKLLDPDIWSLWDRELNGRTPKFDKALLANAADRQFEASLPRLPTIVNISDSEDEEGHLEVTRKRKARMSMSPRQRAYTKKLQLGGGIDLTEPHDYEADEEDVDNSGNARSFEDLDQADRQDGVVIENAPTDEI